jgi:methylated-DNA-[protein]-cysteine S-methyltransferase
MNTLVSYYNSPIGTLRIETKGEFLVALSFENSNNQQSIIGQNLIAEQNTLHQNIHQQLAAYFAAKLVTFNLPIDFQGTDFQKKVWNNLMLIPFGSTISYSQQAKKFGNIKAIRAIAKANGANKIAIIVPCHRVIASGGALTGYVGGLDAKKQLLQLEYENKIKIEPGLLF